HLVDGIPWSRMAVLVRGAAPLGVLRRACASAGVPTLTRLEELPLVEQPAVRPLLRLLELATGRRELDADVVVELVCGPFGGADPLALRRLRQELRRQDRQSGADTPSLALLVEAVADPDRLLAPLPEAVAAPAARVAGLLDTAREA